MRERNVVQRAIDQFGRGHGLERKSGSLYRRTDEVIAVSNLQKSQYGPQYYFNQSFWLRELGPDILFPRYYDCHVRFRLEDLLPKREVQIKELFDLAREIDDEERMLALCFLLDSELFPLIEKTSSTAGLRSMQDDGSLRRALITGPGQQALGIGGDLIR